MFILKNSKNIVNSDKDISIAWSEASNPLTAKKQSTKNILSDYSQEITRPKYDDDIAEIVEVVRLLNNLAPLRMPVYNFNIDEINGEHYYTPDGALLLIREYDGDIIRDYYVEKVITDKNQSVARILEHDKNDGRLRTKIELIKGHGSKLKYSITIFDLKINNKYILMQLAEDGYVNNITEFTGKGKSFRTLYRNVQTFKPARYLEGKDDKEVGFSMVDCLFGADGNVVRIKRFSNKKEVCINYTEDKKNITVKTK